MLQLKQPRVICYILLPFAFWHYNLLHVSFQRMKLGVMYSFKGAAVTPCLHFRDKLFLYLCKYSSPARLGVLALYSLVVYMRRY